MTFNIKSMSALLILMAASTASNAVLISSDLNVVGDGFVTLDTTTGLEWLDLDQTAGWATNDLVNAFGTGGAFEGWRYASYDAWLAFVREGNLDYIPGFAPAEVGGNPPWINEVYLSDVQAMYYLIGAPGYVGQTNQYRLEASIGLLWGEFAHGSVQECSSQPGSMFNCEHNITPWFNIVTSEVIYIGGYDNVRNPSQANPYGHYLVRTAIPEPTGLALFAAGLVGLGLARRAQRAPFGVGTAGNVHRR